MTKQTSNNVVQQESKYWTLQPMLKDDNYIVGQDVITKLDLSNVIYKNVNYNFVNLDLSDNNVLLNLTQFINNNYVVSDNKKNTTYHVLFLSWLLSGNKQSINLGIESKNKLCGFIHGHISKYQLYDKQVEFVEVSFLTVDKKYYGKGVATNLMNEITRQFNMLGYQQGVFATPKNIGKSFVNFKTYYRPINYLKLTKLVLKTQRVTMKKKMKK